MSTIDLSNLHAQGRRVEDIHKLQVHMLQIMCITSVHYSRMGKLKRYACYVEVQEAKRQMLGTS